MESKASLQRDLMVCPNGGGLYAVPKSAVARDYQRGTPLSGDLWRLMTASASSEGLESCQALIEPLLYPGSVVVVMLGDSWVWCMRFGVDTPAFLRSADTNPHKTGWRMLWPINVRTARALALYMRESIEHRTSVLVNQFAPPAQGEWPLVKNALETISSTEAALLTEEAWFLASLNFSKAVRVAPIVPDADIPREKRGRGLPRGAKSEAMAQEAVSRTGRRSVSSPRRRLQLQALPTDLQILIFETAAREVVPSASPICFREWKSLRLLCQTSRCAADRVVRDWMNAVIDGSGLANQSLSTPGQCVYMHKAACASGLSATRLFQMALHNTRMRTVTGHNPSDSRLIALDFAKARAGLRFHAKVPAKRERQSKRLIEQSSRTMGVKLRMRDRSGAITFSMHTISK